jgi:hypothetical protein
MSDDWEYDEYECPRCSAYPTRFMRCPELGCDDGYIDMHEFDDPMLFDDGDYEMCQTCKGTGFVRWCGKCGYELTSADLDADARLEPL